MREIGTQNKRFVNGDGRAVMGTVVTAEWLNAVQDELVGLVTGLGGTVNAETPNQVLQLLNASLAKKMPLATIDYSINKSTDYTKSGFYRANTNKLNELALPNMEIHITHPSEPYASIGAHARGIGFSYGGNSSNGWGLTTTAWDADGAYRGQKIILTEENGVMLTGDQTIAGKKTFSGWTDFATGLRVSTSSKDSWADFGMGPSDVYIKNPISSKVLQLKDDGTLSYSNVKIMLATDRSDAVDLDDTNKLATAKGLKKAYDRGVESAPAGCVNYFAQSTAPTGWLKANGAAVSRTTYADLFSAIGTTFGAGNGTTTFNLPDLRGEFPRGWDDGRGVDAGRVFGSSQADAIQAWTAKMTVQRAQINNVETVSGGVRIAEQSASGIGVPTGGQTWAVGVFETGPGINGTARTAAETRPRNVALLACIKI